MEKKNLKILYLVLVFVVLGILFFGYFVWNVPYHESLHMQNAVYGGCVVVNTSVAMKTDVHCGETVSDEMRVAIYRADTSVELACYIIWSVFALSFIWVYFWKFIVNHKFE